MSCCDTACPAWWDTAFTAAKILAAIGFGLQTAGFLTWVERKQSAVLQDRIGANRASIFGFKLLGLFHILSDALKMMTKEDFAPPQGLKPWHTLAPIISMGCALMCLAALPFGHSVDLFGRTWHLTPIPMTYGVIYVLALLSVGVHGVVMAGWASGSNYALLGGLRGAAQMISYEVAMLAILAGPLYLYGTLDLTQAAAWQARSWHGLPFWGIFLQPLAFILFLTAGAAETKRAPFDLPEGEAEIVGYFVEYSGMKFAMFLNTDFLESIVLAGMTTTLFLGGWHLPGLSHLGLPPLAFALAGVAVFVTKLMAVLWLLMQIRWTLPRFRFDQLLDLGWKNILPLALGNLVATAWAVHFLS